MVGIVDGDEKGNLKGVVISFDIIGLAISVIPFGVAFIPWNLGYPGEPALAQKSTIFLSLSAPFATI